MQDLFLGLDIGTSSVKGSVLDSSGSILTQSEAPNELISRHNGWAEQDTELWKRNIIRVIQNCLCDPHISCSEIRCIGVSGMVPALVLLDRNGNVLRPAIQYNDSRAVTQLQLFTQERTNSGFFQITGANPSVQSVGPKLVWIRENEPEIWDQVSSIMGSYDYINYFLTGELSVERNWALESGLMDLSSQKWSKEMISLFQVPENILPSIRSPLEVIGQVSRQSAYITGLKAGIPVIAGSADHVAAALAAGILHQGDVLIKFGSSGDLLYCSDRLVLDSQLYIDFHCIPGKFLPNGCMATSGSLLKWFVNGFCLADQIAAEKQGLGIYPYLDQQASYIPAGSDGVTVLPFFLGAKTPLNNPEARGVFYGMTLSHNRYHLYRAILEAVAYGFKDHIEVLHKLGLPIKRIIASEGGARSLLWRKISADVLGEPVEFVETNPGSAYGAAFLAGMALQVLDISLLEKNHCQKHVIKPDPGIHNQYQSFYEAYRLLYDQLKPIMHS